MSDMDEVILEFLTESAEGLDQIDRDLIELEHNPTSLDPVRTIFRTMHTIKGTCGFLGFGTLESVAHAAENLLVLLRDGQLQVNEPIVSAILASVDAVRLQIAGIEQTGEDPVNDHSALLATLARLQSGEAAPAAPAALAEAAAPVPPAQHAPAEATAPPAAPAADPTPSAAAAETDEPIDPNDHDAIVANASEKLVGEILVEREVVTPGERFLALQEQAFGDDRRLGEILVEHGATTAEEIEKSVAAEHAARKASSDSTIRVDVGVLDALMNLIGELVLTRNQISKLASKSDDPSFVGPSQRLNAITAELQDEVMRARMQPVGNAWAKIPRVVRDLAKACGKQVVVVSEGEDSELDKTILEAIKDPLTHLVRNSVDHGIESPEVRVASGKPPEGKLGLRAYHESGTVVIEISDDGAGIDADKIRRKLAQKGVMTQAEADATSDREILDTIFQAGFSTAEKTTNVSGRGVGMDVVKTKIESIRGTVDLQTEVGKGTTFIIRIPLTLAIVPALMVRDGGEHYAIEQTHLVELVRLEREAVRAGIEFVHSIPVHRLRGRLLELIDLGRTFGRSTAPLLERDSVDIVVVQVDGREFGLVVDETEDTQDVVVKPLGRHFASVPAFAGATIRGDGGVALILDVRALAQMGGARGELAAVAGIGTGDRDNDASAVNTLIVRIGTSQVALPLGAVVRLEEFPSDAIEVVRGEQRVQYRNELLPLADGSALGAGGPSEFAMGARPDSVNVIVCAGPEGTYGLIVDEIVDIVALDSLDGASEAIVRGVGTAVVELDGSAADANTHTYA